VTALGRLFAPLVLGKVELQNRIVSTAHQTTLVHDHLPSDAFVAYHRARAQGGVGLIVLEATAVHPSGLLTPHTLGGYMPGLSAGYRRLAKAVHPSGTRLFVQLFHGGREQISTPPREPAIAPSAVPSQRFRVEPRAARAVDIGEIVDGYARAAEIAAEGGVDGVEISAAHRYLIEQFFDPELNRRSDEWSDGARFLVAVVEAVRRAAPGLTLGIRLSADSARARAIVRALPRSSVDYLSVALGDSSSYLGSVGIVPPPPIQTDAIAERTRPFRSGVPLIATSRIVDPVSADRLIANGVTDAVGMTRALITDPDLPSKARSGRLEEIVRCIGCNACIAHYHAGTPIACAVNPRTGRESSFESARPAHGPDRRRIVVAGGGPAGIAAAVEAGLAGHEVVLLERADRLGGQIALAAAAPGNAELAQRFAHNGERRLALARVDVRLGSHATVEGVMALEPDAVVVATGARPYRDDRLELEGIEVLHAWDVLAGSVPHGKTVVVADWGGDPGGLDAAELLPDAANDVTIGIASVAVGETIHQYRRNLYLRRLYTAGVTIVHHVELSGAEDGTVGFRNVFAPDLNVTFAADVLVLAQGRVPDDALWLALADAGIRVEAAGDCRSPRSLEEAVLEGTLAAQRVVA
jgi:2,4-dienoyl-CoA reductase-like NADH-dependent reductase (Old Yellow Enzyme family)/thioredoxin reductase